MTSEFSYRIHVSRCSLIITIMTAALTLRRNISVFSRQPENCPSVSDVVLISGGRLYNLFSFCSCFNNMSLGKAVFWAIAKFFWAAAINEKKNNFVVFIK